MKTFTNLLFIIGSSMAFAPCLGPVKSSVVLSMSAEEEAVSRRSAVLKLGGATAAALVATAAVPHAAVADQSSDDMVARIAAQSVKANEAARTKKEKDEAAQAKSKEGVNPALLVGGGGLALSLPFFLPNPLRLGTKLGSGGEDDGYGK